jgi:DNA helicase-2/ATP-dependent DNA helicase PcrA
MENLKTERDGILNQISEINSKLFDLQNKLLETERKIIDSDHKEIMDSLTLNEQQLSVVNATEKNIVTVAAPGSGKTHTLISMFIKLIVEDKLDPTNILLITFTKKAGQEMAGRLSSIIPTKLPSYIGSLHGLAYRILQKYHNINYTVIDEKETRDLLKDICDKNLSDNDDIENGLIKSKISYIIDKASSSYPFDIKEILKDFNLEKLEDKINDIIKIFRERKKVENLLDFNDLMILFCNFLDSKGSKEYKDSIKFVFFDEYQDVNPIQHYILSKFKKNSRIMVVGDDAQSIYAFRGSSVKFILNFPKEFKPNKMYLLEKNYRSTKQIVNFFQDIIAKNTNQYKKDVISVNPSDGVKPSIFGFENDSKRDQWIINDIIKNKNNGVPISKMVILARKNNSLDKIEIELVKQGITVIKHTGLSILDKAHVKDFLAFLTVIVNEKSSIHWKRILSLQIGVNSAHQIIENSNNIRESIKKLKDTQANYANYLKELDGLFNIITNKMNFMKDIEKARYILLFLEKIWSSKKNNSHLEDKIKDIHLLLSYLNTTNIQQFITELYLNQSIEINLDNSIYLTTIHGAKGLEWDYVYLIDVDSDNFPAIKTNYFKQEGDETEEERRLFYVACSRAKQNLIITYNYCFNPSSYLNMSPFIREIEPKLYNSIGMNYDFMPMSGNISHDVNNYLKYLGFGKIYPKLKELECDRKSIHSGIEIPKYLDKFRYSRSVIGNFYDFLIAKIIQINFTKNIKKFELNTNHRLEKFPQKIRQNYNDELTDWRNLLDDIFSIATFGMKDEGNIFKDLKNFLINSNMFEHYQKISNHFSNFITEMKPTEIKSHYNVSHANIRGEIDLLIDDSIIEIKTNQYEIATTANICQTLIYGYLLQKKLKKINNIILYNPISGEITKLNTSNIDYKEIANILYGHFKKSN